MMFTRILSAEVERISRSYTVSKLAKIIFDLTEITDYLLGCKNGVHILLVVLGHCKHGGHLRADEGSCENQVHGQLVDALPHLNSLVHTFLREGHVHAACEEVLRVPLRLSVTDQYQC